MEGDGGRWRAAVTCTPASTQPSITGPPCAAASNPATQAARSPSIVSCAGGGKGSECLVYTQVHSAVPALLVETYLAEHVKGSGKQV